MRNSQNILVVEDQSREKDALIRLLRHEGFTAHGASNLQEALDWIDRSIDLLICDLCLGQESGLKVLEFWRTRRPEVPLIMVTAFGDVDSAVAAMKMGAIDYLTKPLKPEELLMLLNRYLPMQHRGTNELQLDTTGLGRMIGQSNSMRTVFEQIRKVSASDSLVLITGESGTGKELVASAIHEHSRRCDGPYVAVNVTALPESLMEAELFGYVRGAFTGAALDRPGRFLAAHQGTLFVDEIGDFSLALQPKLLRVLESFTFCPVGADAEVKVDVRLVAATSRNLREMVRKEQFRADLFHRLNVLTIELPALRERPEDIPSLVQYFVSDCAKRHLRQAPEIDRDLMSFLERYDWPGNVRQLRNTIENMMVLGNGVRLTMDDLPKSFSGGLVSTDAPRYVLPRVNLSELEKSAILTALSNSMGNRTHAAQKLGISVRTLQRKLKQWGIEPGTNPVE